MFVFSWHRAAEGDLESPSALASDPVPLSLDGSLDSPSGSLGHWGVAYVAGRVFGVSLPGLKSQTETPSTT